MGIRRCQVKINDRPGYGSKLLDQNVNKYRGDYPTAKQIVKIILCIQMIGGSIHQNNILV